MKIRRLKTASEVIDEIGSDRLRELTGRKSQHITNWRASGFLPHDFFLIMTEELAERECTAPAALWRIIEPKKSRAA